tara:strand:- start:1039 stop:1209 length:171 start_codon:yes stop_codon:yes gene_type:complete
VGFSDIINAICSFPIIIIDAKDGAEISMKNTASLHLKTQITNYLSSWQTSEQVLVS